MLSFPVGAMLFVVICLIASVAFKIGQKKEAGTLITLEELKAKCLPKKKRRGSKKRV